MAGSISEALLSLALAQGVRLPEALGEVTSEGLASEREIALFQSLARLLVRQHKIPVLAPPTAYRDAFRRSITDEGSGVLALLDALPQGKNGLETQRLSAFERRYLAWRWRLREREGRLRKIHRALRLEQVMVLPDGEVILFEPQIDLGDPAADLSAIAVGLLEMAAREPLSWFDGYKPLFDALWSTYLADSGDHEMLDVAPPFLAFRALAAAATPSPDRPLTPTAQRKLFAFAEEALAQRSFDPDEVAWLAR